MKTRIFRMLLLTAVMMIMEISSVFAGIVTVTGQGSSERNALHDAMRQAIEREVGVIIDSRTYVENFQVINDRIYSQSMGYIEGYEVLNTSYANGIWRVDIKAQVRSDALRTELMSQLQKKAIINANMQDPRIGVVAMDGNGYEYFNLENAIISGLQHQGFSRLIDLSQIDASIKMRIASAEAEGNLELRNMLLNQFHVDYMVTARVSTRSNGDVVGAVIHQIPETDPIGNILRTVGTGYGKVSSNIGVRMMNVNTGEIVYAGSFSGKASGSNAANDAVVNASNDIVRAISQAALHKAANPEQHITLIITNGVFSSVGEAYQYISAMPGVNRVFTRSASYGTIQVDIDYDGTAYDLAFEIERRGGVIKEMNSEYIKI